MSEPGRGRAEPKPFRILLVEDDPHLAEILAELLALEGFRVVVAEEAEAGLARARAEPPDMVLCDITLPGALDGHGFARACRADPALRGLHLVAVSGRCRAEDRQRAIEAGFDRLIAKPIELASVHAALKEVRRAP
jgi:two-component system CheB/CheR fusion protein